MSDGKAKEQKRGKGRVCWELTLIFSTALNAILAESSVLCNVFLWYTASVKIQDPERRGLLCV